MRAPARNRMSRLNGTIRPRAARLSGPARPTDDSGGVPLDFTAIDFETANSSNASACAVGLARVRDGEVVARAGWLIQPPPGHDRFFQLNTRIHGIRECDVADARGWSAQLPELLAFMGDDVIAAHNAGFDMTVLRRACEATGDTWPVMRYVCSLQVSRKTYELDSYRLPVVAAAAGFLDFPHHDAAADALACAHILIHAARLLRAHDVDALAELAGVKVAALAASPPTTPEPVLAAVRT